VNLEEPHRPFDQGGVAPDAARGVSVPPYLPDNAPTREDLSGLQGAIRAADEAVGRILAALDGAGLADATLVTFTTDHGIAMPRAKCSLYEPGMRTSFLLHYPREGWRGGIRRKELISNIDLLPTVLDLAGIPVADNVHGRSLAPLLENRSYTPRDRIFGELTYHDYYDPRRSIRTATHKLIVNFSSAPAFMDPSQSWRPRGDTVVPPNHALAYHPPFELYDLAHDPWEQKDLAGDPSAAQVLQQLRSQLAEHLRATKDPILNGAVTSPLHQKSQAWLVG
jgi:N-sulfoglucosamine sulfohydrolase